MNDTIPTGDNVITQGNRIRTQDQLVGTLSWTGKLSNCQRIAKNTGFHYWVYL